jgi:hypothetical protein
MAWLPWIPLLCHYLRRAPLPFAGWVCEPFAWGVQKFSWSVCPPSTIALRCISRGRPAGPHEAFRRKVSQHCLGSIPSALYGRLKVERASFIAPSSAGTDNLWKDSAQALGRPSDPATASPPDRRPPIPPADRSAGPTPPTCVNAYTVEQEAYQRHHGRTQQRA